jgi:hypothetical protein
LDKKMKKKRGWREERDKETKRPRGLEIELRVHRFGHRECSSRVLGT